MRTSMTSALTALCLLSVAPAAGATTTTVGSPLTASFAQTQTQSVASIANTALSDSAARVAAPYAGVVRRWRFQGTGVFSLQVLHPNAGGTYTATATSAPATGNGATTVTSTTALPIAAGDLVAIAHGDSADEIGVAPAGPSAATYAFWLPALATGDTRAPSATWPGETAFNADVDAAPAVSLLTPGSGPVAGTNTVAIGGRDFTGTTAVTFGGRPAMSFTILSDSLLSAVAPAGAAGAVDVLVTTRNGTSPAGDASRYTYVAPSPAATGRPASPPTDGLPRLGAVGAIATLLSAPSPERAGVRLNLACVGPANTYCAFASRLLVPAGARARRRARAAGVSKAKKAKRAYLTVGVRRAKIKAGAKWSAKIDLDTAGRRLLRRSGRLPVLVATTYTAANGKVVRLPLSRVTIRGR